MLQGRHYKSLILLTVLELSSLIKSELLVEKNPLISFPLFTNMDYSSQPSFHFYLKHVAWLTTVRCWYSPEIRLLKLRWCHSQLSSIRCLLYFFKEVISIYTEYIEIPLQKSNFNKCLPTWKSILLKDTQIRV